VACLDRVQFRLAESHDATGIAALHADSWRRHYRGAYSDAFLDGEVFADRLAVWTGRLDKPGPGYCTILAEDNGMLVGFTHVIFDDDSSWGALLDNLHVTYGHTRKGIGSKLLVLAAEAVVGWVPRTGLYLWVLEQNVNAQAFYRAQKGQYIERSYAAPPSGDPSQLNGSPAKLRYAWSDPGVLLKDRARP
jgi:GNAT superfamily N-acetyltransferase